MAVILDVGTTPQVFADGAYPLAAMNTAAWKFSFTPTSAISGDRALFTAAYSGVGGVWLIGSSLNIYSTTDSLLVARAFTATLNVPITVTIDPVADTVTIAGAASGNGTFAVTNGVYFASGESLAVGGNGQGQYNFAGTISDVEDLASSSIDGSAATSLAELTSAATGALSIVGSGAADTTDLVALVMSSAAVSGLSAVTLAEPAVIASGSLSIAGTAAASLAELVASAAEPSSYTLAPFESYPAYPSGQKLVTNWWAFGAPLIVRDRDHGEIICPVRSDDDNVYLLVSEDRGQNWRFVGRTGGGSDPLFNHSLYSCVQSSDGAYHLLSGDGNDGVSYSRLVLVRDGSDAITSYTRQTGALAVFGGESVEHVAMLTVARDQSGTECLIAHMQDAPGASMAIYAAKTLTTTPTSAADFTKLDGTSGYTTVVSGLSHNAHEHVSYHSYLSASGDVVFFRAHKPAEGFQTGAGYAQVYHLRATQSGAHTWALGSWQAYEAGQGVHLRGVCQTTDTIYLLASYQTSGVSIDRWSAGTYTKGVIAAPTTLYSPNATVDGAISCSSDGARIFVYIATYSSSPTSSGYFACYESGSWTKSAAQNPPWQNYSASGSTGDDFGLYAVRADGTYGSTTPTIGGYYVTEPDTSISGTVAASQDLAASASGALSLSGTSAATLAEPVVASAGTLAINGTSAITVVELQLNTSAQADGTAALLLAELTAAASGELSLTGTAAASLDEPVAASAGALSMSGTATATLDELTLLAGADTVLPNNGTAAATLDECTAAASGALSIGGTGALDLGELTVASSGSFAFVGTAAASLDALTAAAETFLGGITATSASEVLLYARAGDGSRRPIGIGGVLAARARVRRGRAR